MRTSEQAKAARAPLTCERAIAELESGYDVVEWDAGQGWPHIAPSGEPYVTVTCGGVKPEGAALTLDASTEDEALRFWLAEARKCGGEGKTILYWRQKPRVTRETNGRYTVFSRLCFGAEPHGL